MAGENTLTTLNGLVKEVYGDALEEARPKGVYLLRDIQFVPRNQRPGNTFHQPVALSYEHGFTYAAAGSGAFQLNDAIAQNIRDAQVVGTQLMLRSRIDIETAARAASGGVRAFRAAMDVVFENMSDSHNKRCEIDLFYGQSGIGKVQSVNTTTKVVTIEATEWAPGIWAGMENAKIGAFDTTADSATWRNSTWVKITAIDLVNRQVTLSDVTSIATGDHLYFQTQRTTTGHNVFKGLHALTGATSGTVLNIDSDTYSLWQGTVIDKTSSAISFGVINRALAVAAGKGLDEDVVAYVNPEQWAVLASDEAAFRRHNQVGRYDVGTDGLTFYSQNGRITIKASTFCKNGYVYIISPRYWRRVGATDITFRLPDRGDEFFLHVPDWAAYELRSYSNFALFTRALAKSIHLKVKAAT